MASDQPYKYEHRMYNTHNNTSPEANSRHDFPQNEVRAHNENDEPQENRIVMGRKGRRLRWGGGTQCFTTGLSHSHE